MSAQVAFGRRGGNPRAEPGAAAGKVAPASPEPSAIYEELASAARLAFRDGRTRETSFEPATPAAPSRALGDEEAMRAFIGPNWSAFRRLWERDRLDPRLRSSFGFGPTLFGATWLLYRKRYLLGFLCVAAESATAYWAPWFTFAAAAVVRGMIGRYGKSLVLKAGAAEIARELRGEDAANARLSRLRKAGGVNPWLPILLMLGEAWLAVHGIDGRHAAGLDPAELLGDVQRALP